MADNSVAIALDVGGRRIGIARANLTVGIASPMLTLERSGSSVSDILRLVADSGAEAVIIGLPRGLDGQETSQTTAVRDFASELRKQLKVAIIFQDEALTSKKAEAELNNRGKPYKKSDIDSLAATYILEDYISSVRNHVL